MEKVLVIKTGHTELLTNELSGGPSLGDVFRSTCILDEFLDAHVTWLTSESAMSLLPGAPLVNEVLDCNVTNLIRLCAREFDTVINLERCEELASWYRSFLDSTKPKRVLGFHNGNGHNGNAANDSVRIPSAQEQENPYQYYLFDLIGKTWRCQRYAIPGNVNPTVEPHIMVGFNHAVGPKWPVKAWPMNNWEKLATLCEKQGYSYSFQEGFTDLNQYISWIQKHEIIVSTDSLGIHLALALGRTVIGLFGPTRASDVYFYGQGEGITATSSCPKKPCFAHQCDFTKHCMENISAESVFNTVAQHVNRIVDPSYVFPDLQSSLTEKRI